MNDEQFEHAIGHFIPEIQEQMRARDTTQREALARLEAELNAKPADDLAQACIAQLIESGAENYTEHHFGFVRDGENVERPAVVTVQFSDRPSPHELRIKAEAERDNAQAQLAEAVGLLRKVRMCGVLGESGPDVDSEIGQFLARRTQVEQQEAQSPMAKIAEGLRQKAADEWANHPSNPANQEAQGAQAVDERAAFEQWFFAAEKISLEEYPHWNARDELGQYRSHIVQQAWVVWQARAALATQPEVPEQHEYWCIAFGRWRPIQELVEFLTSRGFKVRAVRGAEHE